MERIPAWQSRRFRDRFRHNEARNDVVVRIIELLRERPPWMRHARCRETPTVDFLSERGESCDAAKQVCAGCLVRVECLDYALDLAIDDGVWGGTSGLERRALTARR